MAIWQLNPSADCWLRAQAWLDILFVETGRKIRLRNNSPFRLKDLTSCVNRLKLKVDFNVYLDGFPQTYRKPLEKIKF